MSEYMSFELMEEVAAEVGESIYKISNPWREEECVANIGSLREWLYVVKANGEVKRELLEDGFSGWISVYETDRFEYYANLTSGRYCASGYHLGSASISEYQMKIGLERLQKKERKPIFVGTRRVSGVWMKQGQQLVKPSGVYIKQNGTIKKM